MREQRIITFGLSDRQNELIQSNIPVNDYQVLAADDPTDLIALEGRALIVRAAALDDERMELLLDYCCLVNGCTDQAVLWLGEPRPPAELRKFIKYCPSFSNVKKRLNDLLLKARTNSEPTEIYHQKYVRGIRILILIHNQPGITTKELAEKTERSAYSVKQSIRDLRTDGNWIEYDHSLRGWKLDPGPPLPFTVF